MLPNLPKKNNKKEANFGLKFRKWIEENPQPSGTYELKDSRGKDYFAFDELTDDQINHALRTKSKKGNLIRVEVGNPGAPDYVHFRGSYAWVVIQFKRGFHIIDIDTFLLEKKKSIRKSLTSARAKEISTISVI